MDSNIILETYKSDIKLDIEGKENNIKENKDNNYYKDMYNIAFTYYFNKYNIKKKI